MVEPRRAAQPANNRKQGRIIGLAGAACMHGGPARWLAFRSCKRSHVRPGSRDDMPKEMGKPTYDCRGQGGVAPRQPERVGASGAVTNLAAADRCARRTAAMLCGCAVHAQQQEGRCHASRHVCNTAGRSRCSPGQAQSTGTPAEEGRARRGAGGGGGEAALACARYAGAAAVICAAHWQQPCRMVCLALYSGSTLASC